MKAGRGWVPQKVPGGVRKAKARGAAKAGAKATRKAR
jgi:hypothetical protein